MNISTSEYGSGSGVESGWTLYLDQSSLSDYNFERAGGIAEQGDKVTRMAEVEDLSMVSDASSGPPHYSDNGDECYCESWCTCHSSSSSKLNKKTKKKQKVKEQSRIQHPSLLDDTASSPVFNCTKKKVNFSENEAYALNVSHGYSATEFKGTSTFQKQLGLFQSSLSGKQASEESGCFSGAKWK
ncbi:Angiogenin-2 like [Quillaja saponaria]|uniref:Angiogenin-2 like n=1 Tax=Quillaja saponaria TaxID=32244 RepID=A0AAD7LYJ2_QUISA|nr:Angiogenin-2 like [Quillaja saponaria]